MACKGSLREQAWADTDFGSGARAQEHVRAATSPPPSFCVATLGCTWPPPKQHTSELRAEPQAQVIQRKWSRGKLRPSPPYCVRRPQSTGPGSIDRNGGWLPESVLGVWALPGRSKGVHLTQRQRALRPRLRCHSAPAASTRKANGHRLHMFTATASRFSRPWYPDVAERGESARTALSVPCHKSTSMQLNATPSSMHHSSLTYPETELAQR